MNNSPSTSPAPNPRHSQIRMTPNTASHRVRQFWNWLPAFRAVAESGAVNSTAPIYGTSPSALSRSIRLLEHAVGKQLFLRQRGRLVLTRDGERALAAIQLATRLLDDAFTSNMDEPAAIAVGAEP